MAYLSDCQIACIPALRAGTLTFKFPRSHFLEKGNYFFVPDSFCFAAAHPPGGSSTSIHTGGRGNGDDRAARGRVVLRQHLPAQAEGYIDSGA